MRTQRAYLEQVIRASVLLHPIRSLGKCRGGALERLRCCSGSVQVQQVRRRRRQRVQHQRIVRRTRHRDVRAYERLLSLRRRAVCGGLSARGRCAICERGRRSGARRRADVDLPALAALRQQDT